MSLERRVPSSLQLLTLLLTALATMAMELAIVEPSTSDTLAVFRALVWMAPVGLTAWWLNRGDRIKLFVISLVLLGVFGLPYVVEGVRYATTGQGAMLEVVMLAALRNLGLGLAALAGRSGFARLSALVALFGLLISSALVDGLVMAALVAAFSVVGTLWLMANYWLGLPIRSGLGRSVPVVGTATVLLVVGVVAAVAAVGPTRAATILAGWMPTSGGTDWTNPDARGGVNDGPNEVSASSDPRSVGYSQSDIYLDSDQPSLYDAFNDMYGEPYKKEKTERALAISTDQIIEQDREPAENLRAGREFPTLRQQPETRREPKSIATNALVYVKGRVPVHLRLTAYDRFDGQTWEEAPQVVGRCPLRSEGEASPWLGLDLVDSPVFSGRVSHQFKVGRLDTQAIPAPAHLARFRVGSVNRIDFYGWAQDQILQMNDRTIPAGTVVETEARTIHPRRLREVEFPESPLYALPRHRSSSGFPIVKDLARSWVADLPRGWAQVEAVLHHLRGHCVHDRNATVPEDCPDVLAHFLVESRRGPDYLFATAAALMLRSLGYPTRVVSGFYVNPNRYDPVTRQTPVVAEDVHFWVEVYLPGGLWVAVEPTPGYHLMPAALSPWDQLAEAFHSAWGWTRRNAIAISITSFAVAFIWGYRRTLLDRAATGCWRLMLWGGASRRLIPRTLWLVEHRSRWAGRPRPIGATPTQWYGTLSAAAPPELQADLQRFVRLANWCLYAPQAEPGKAPAPWTEQDLRETCLRAIQSWTLGTFRTATKANASRSRKVAPS